MATATTRQHHNKVLEELNFSDEQDFEDAKRGFIATLEEGEIRNDTGIVYSMKKDDFLNDECPDTVNPSLWRQSQLNKINGLFEVLPDKIYQVRNFDVSNITFVRGKTSWIVIDALVSEECVKESIKIFRKHVSTLPIKHVIITHPHGDHFGGINALTNSSTKVYVPKHFFEEMISENVFAGKAMERRSQFMFGLYLPKSPSYFIGNGLGQQASFGQYSIPKKENLIEIDGNYELNIDGIQVLFIDAPQSEAPVEFMLYFPDYKAFCQAELINHTFHNLVTPRGAKARNGKLWSSYIDYAIENFGDEVEVTFGTHNWPVWDNKRVKHFWEVQRDLYKYVHDQTLRYANMGCTYNELPELIHLPKSISQEFSCRSYYGSVSHNVKAQYQYYLGWYDGNPAHLDELQPTELAERYVQAIGGEEKVLKLGEDAYSKGDYRWAVTLLNHLIFFNPSNLQARKLLAKVFTQLGYMQECATWRNMYLTGAYELSEKKATELQFGLDWIKFMNMLDISVVFDALSIFIDPAKVDGLTAKININFKELNEEYCLIIQNCVLTVRKKKVNDPTFEITITKTQLFSIFDKSTDVIALLNDVTTNCKGEKKHFLQFLSSISNSEQLFNIVEP
ncbi:Metallo-beta-lactamase domain-containing protein [Entamoeba marina]